MLSVTLASVALKIVKMFPSMKRLKQAGVDHPLARLIAFTYGTKWHWLRGASAGLKRGRVDCLDCRRRLREMTPERYQAARTQAEADC